MEIKRQCVRRESTICYPTFNVYHVLLKKKYASAKKAFVCTEPIKENGIVFLCCNFEIQPAGNDRDGRIKLRDHKFQSPWLKGLSRECSYLKPVS